MTENKSLIDFKERNYTHCQSLEWGLREFTPDPRVTPDNEYKCPSCNSGMIYASESYEPYGDLFYCPECRKGWLVRDQYWKHQPENKGEP